MLSYEMVHVDENQKGAMMKKLFVLTFLMSFSLASICQSIKHISLAFNVDDFKIQQDEAGNSFILPNDYSAFFMSDTLLPALPYFGCNVFIPDAKLYVSHTCSGSKVLIQNNITLGQNPEAVPTNMQLPVKRAESVPSYTNRVYPAKYVEYAGMNEFGNYRVLSFHVCPFEYDDVAKKLYFRPTIDFDISLNEGERVSPSNIKSSIMESVKDVIRSIVVNPEDMEEPTTSNTGLRSNGSLTLQTGYEYVVVTTNQLKSVFQELADWKSRKGIRAKVITIEDITSTYSGLTTQEKIKRALADIDGLSYVLLGGDAQIVPTCRCYLGHQTQADSITLADSYYACLGTMNWDNNGNGLYGELADNVCLLPSLNVSRAPVEDVECARAFVSRIISYESAPDTTNWDDNILMCGTSLGYTDDHDGIWKPWRDSISGQSDTQIWGQMIYNQSIAPYWDGELTRFYDTYTDISGDSTYDFNVSNLQSELSKGYTFVDVMTHGGKTSWNMEGNYPYYWRGDASGLMNSGYSIITTIACNTNAFDYRTEHGRCLSQCFISNPQSGVLAYWGTSRENWSTRLYPNKPIPNYGVGAEFDRLTYEKLFGNRYHRMGKATTEVKTEKMSSAVSSYFYTLTRMVWMGLNLMGDPEMPVYLSKPKSFQNVSVQYINDSVYVNTGTGEFDICLINQSDSTDYHIAREIPDSTAVFSLPSGVYDVCIIKPGYIPYTTVCGDTYIQNITLADTNVFETNNAMIGSNVTDRISSGPVVINSGITIVKANQGTTIARDFEVKLGAEFSITNE